MRFILLGILTVWHYTYASNCPIVQQEFRDGNQTSSTGYGLRTYYGENYIPQCTAGGLFERIQCTSLNQSVPIQSYYNPPIRCWCVDPVTGISVDYYPVYGQKNESECDNTANTRELCEGYSGFAVEPGSCSYIDCSIGPNSAYIVDCFFSKCGLLQREVSGRGCCDYTCVGAGLGDLTVAEEAIIAVTVVAFVLVVIVIIIAVVVICCVVCKKTKVTQSAHPFAANNVQFSILEEKVDIPEVNQA